VDEHRLCSNCGFDPIPNLAVTPAAPAAAVPPAESHGKRTFKKKKSRHIMTKLIGGWILLLALIIGGARLIWHDEAATATSETTTTDTSTVSAEDLALLEKAAPTCIQVFSNYLAAGTPEHSNPFVHKSVETLSRMVRFYNENPLTTVEPSSLTLAGRSILHRNGAKDIELQWNSSEGLKIDTVFRKENDEWKLDWEHFARFSDYPWPLFLAGSGPSEGEFRLLARERLADERKDLEDISLVFYTPRFGHPDEASVQSPEFLVSRNSPDGRMLDAAFKQARAGGRMFDSKLPSLDPNGMIRVRVKIRRIEQNETRNFEITDVVACHWLAVDEPGIEIPEGDHSDR
jgi:hypothetical protein